MLDSAYNNITTEQKTAIIETLHNLCDPTDLISFEEIENDFKDFKSKSEDIQVQKELIQLIRKAENESCRNECYENYKRIKRPQNPFCKNIE